MGIRGLNTIIEKYNTTDNCRIKSIYKTNLSFVKGKKVCIDISQFIHCCTVKDKRAYLSGILNLINKLRKYKIQPLVIFDGKPPKEKQKTNEQRNKQRKKFRELSEELEIKQDYNSKIISMFKTRKNDIKNNPILLDSVILSESSSDVSDDILDSGLESLESSLELTDDDFDDGILNINEHNIDNILESFKSISDNYNIDFIINFLKLIKPNISHYKFITLDLNNLNSESYIDNLIKKYNVVNTDLEIKKNKAKNKSSSMSSYMIKDIKKFLDLLKIPYIHPEIEADLLCAYLVKQKIVDYCISNDMDMIAYGCPNIIRNLNFKNDDIDIYSLNNILYNLKMNYEKLVEFCILLGCEYTSRIIGINNELAFKLIHEYNSIDNIILHIDDISDKYKKLYIPQNFNFINSKNLFMKQIEYNFDKHCFDTMNKQLKTISNPINKDKYNEIKNYCIDKMPNITKYLITKQLKTIICN